MTALYEKEKDFVKELAAFQGFSDIVFNPNRSINCQARAAALFVSLSKNGLMDEKIFRDKDHYLALITGEDVLPPTESNPTQDTFQFSFIYPHFFLSIDYSCYRLLCV